MYGEDDDLGKAGILTHIMNIEEIANAMVYMAENPEERRRMANVGYRRLIRKYKIEDMKKTYEGIYRKAAERQNINFE